jgi:NAD(P)-dependent dehydrogenase (short-subunit alcohol dehydrogenase family)
MKVAITGHTSGIGQGLANYFAEQGHEVIGFARSNGHALPDAHVNVLKQIIDCDVFVNNSEPVSSQIFLLNKLWPRWKSQHKHIIVIGSVLGKINEHLPEYESAQREKRELDEVCNRLRYDQAGGINCLLTAIHPSFVATNIWNEYSVPQPPDAITMSVSEVVTVVDMVLKSPVVIEDITFRKR